MENVQVLAYLASVTHISRKIASDEKSLIRYLGNKWSEYSEEQKEELLNDLCVPHSIREQYRPLPADDEDGDISSQPVCWPVLKLPSGEKIIVDDTDIWTWQDEHSGPFSWKSKSQQDLSLPDFEPDNLTKPYSKRNKPSDSEAHPPPAHACQANFAPNPASWTGAVLADYFTNCKIEVQTPVHTPLSKLSPTEEVNQGFEDSLQDLSCSATPVHAGNLPLSASRDTNHNDIAAQANQAVDHVTPEVLEAVQNYATKAKSKGHVKTPSPKKQSNPDSVWNEATDSNRQLLMREGKEDDSSAFANPALEVEWSTFVGQSSVDPRKDAPNSNFLLEIPLQNSGIARNTSASLIQVAASHSEPVAMVIDRGIDFGTASGGEESAESTPDHTAQLLKHPGGSGSATDQTMMMQAEEEKEEVVYVTQDAGGSVIVASQLVPTSTSDANETSLRTGFDFLDNW